MKMFNTKKIFTKTEGYYETHKHECQKREQSLVRYTYAALNAATAVSVTLISMTPTGSVVTQSPFKLSRTLNG